MIESIHGWRWLLYVLLALAAAGDIRALKIPNIFPLTIVAAAALGLVVNSAAPDDYFRAALSGLIGLGVGYGFFVIGMMGGGDGKLFAAGATWFAPAGLLTAGLSISVAGLVLASAVFGARSIRHMNAGKPFGAVARAALKTRIPYGVAIAAGFIIAAQLAA